MGGSPGKTLRPEAAGVCGGRWVRRCVEPQDVSPVATSLASGGEVLMRRRRAGRFEQQAICH